MLSVMYFYVAEHFQARLMFNSNITPHFLSTVFQLLFFGLIYDDFIHKRRPTSTFLQLLGILFISPVICESPAV